MKWIFLLVNSCSFPSHRLDTSEIAHGSPNIGNLFSGIKNVFKLAFLLEKKVK